MGFTGYKLLDWIFWVSAEADTTLSYDIYLLIIDSNTLFKYLNQQISHFKCLFITSVMILIFCVLHFTVPQVHYKVCETENFYFLHLSVVI